MSVGLLSIEQTTEPRLKQICYRCTLDAEEVLPLNVFFPENLFIKSNCGVSEHFSANNFRKICQSKIVFILFKSAKNYFSNNTKLIL